MNITKENQKIPKNTKKIPKIEKKKGKRISQIIRERLQTFANVH